jgi:hypothetical protein
MKTKSFLILAFIAALSLIVISCSSGKSYKKSKSYSSVTYDTKGVSGTSTNQITDADTKDLVPPDRMMIYKADITVIVRKPDTANAKIIKIAKKYNGYVLNTGSTYTTIRVKADSLYFALDEIANIGKVKDKNVYAEDITEEYTDLGIRLENAEKARIRYLELLAKAENVEETLLVEKELERLNTDIDLLEGKINKLSHLEEYSTITVYVQEKVRPGPIGFVFKYLYKGVRYLFILD